MKIDRAGAPFVAGALIPAAALAIGRKFTWAAGFAGLGAFMAFFFRDPERQVPAGAGLVVSPADGRVMMAGMADARWAPPGTWKQITIFLSPLDVQINRSPVGGRVTKIAYRPGRFLPAYDERSNENERNEIWIDTGEGVVVVRQIVGILARRVVCRIREGEAVERGGRIGLMKFGSRMDVFLPEPAELQVQAGRRVIAGETVVATMKGAGAQ
jgi:phosphatidylserine decarboxylase